LNHPHDFNPQAQAASPALQRPSGGAPSRAEFEDLPPDGALSCIAAFYSGESAMRDAARSLLEHHGLKTSHLVLMAPGDAEPARFARQALRWTGRWAGGAADGLDLPLFSAVAAGLLMSALVLAWWALDNEAPLLPLLVGISVLTLAAALLGSRRHWPWSEPPRVRRFEASVQRQLSEGVWALVVHGIPRDRQSGVVALLRGASLRWCAVARPSMRL
jgi:hypothetical protein